MNNTNLNFLFESKEASLQINNKLSNLVILDIV
jgi:hypothetical protein